MFPFPAEFSLFSFNNGMVVSSCRELDNNRSALSAASAFAIATAGANEGTPTKEKYRRMSLASTGTSHEGDVLTHREAFWGISGSWKLKGIWIQNQRLKSSMIEIETDLLLMIL